MAMETNAEIPSHVDFDELNYEFESVSEFKIEIETEFETNIQEEMTFSSQPASMEMQHLASPNPVPEQFNVIFLQIPKVEGESGVQLQTENLVTTPAPASLLKQVEVKGKLLKQSKAKKKTKNSASTIPVIDPIGNHSLDEMQETTEQERTVNPSKIIETSNNNADLDDSQNQEWNENGKKSRNKNQSRNRNKKRKKNRNVNKKRNLNQNKCKVQDQTQNQKEQKNQDEKQKQKERNDQNRSEHKNEDPNKKQTEPYNEAQNEKQIEPNNDAQNEKQTEPNNEVQNEKQTEPNNEDQNEMQNKPNSEDQNEMQNKPNSEDQNEMQNKPNSEDQNEIQTEPNNEDNNEKPNVSNNNDQNEKPNVSNNDDQNEKQNEPNNDDQNENQNEPNNDDQNEQQNEPNNDDQNEQQNEGKTEDQNAKQKQTRYKCTDCPRSFHLKLSLIEHIKKAHQGNSTLNRINMDQPFYICLRCSKTFPEESDVLLHVANAHASQVQWNSRRTKRNKANEEKDLPRTYECHATTCRNTYNTSLSLDEHELTHKDEDTLWRCLSCQDIFDLRKLLMEHLPCHENKNAHVNPFKCTKCYLNLGGERELKTHLMECSVHGRKRKHPVQVYTLSDDSEDEINRMEKRDQLEAEEARRMVEIKKWEKELQLFRASWARKTQKRNPRNGSSSSTKRHGNGDRKRHSFVCPVKQCARSFTSLTGVTIHFRKCHGANPFHCPVAHCSKSFFYRKLLRKHEASHPQKSTRNENKSKNEETNERNYKCQIEECAKIFPDWDELQSHWSLEHPNEPSISGRIYKCCKQGCSEYFFRSHLLTIHMASSHGARKPYKCPICDMGFATQHSRDAHYQSRHDEFSDTEYDWSRN